MNIIIGVAIIWITLLILFTGGSYYRVPVVLNNGQRKTVVVGARSATGANTSMGDTIVMLSFRTEDGEMIPRSSISSWQSVTEADKIKKK